jgi:hypothetical protein
MLKKTPRRAAVQTSADDPFPEKPLRFRIPSPFNDKDEAVVCLYLPRHILEVPPPQILERVAREKLGPKFSEYKPLIRLLRRRSWPDFLPLDVLPPSLRAAVMSLSQPRRRGKDRAIAHFIQERMLLGFKHEALVKEAADHFGLSRSAIFRALARDKRRYPGLWGQGGLGRTELELAGIKFTSFQQSRRIAI